MPCCVGRCTWVVAVICFTLFSCLCFVPQAQVYLCGDSTNGGLITDSDECAGSILKCCDNPNSTDVDRGMMNKCDCTVKCLSSQSCSDTTIRIYTSYYDENNVIIECNHSSNACPSLTVSPSSLGTDQDSVDPSAMRARESSIDTHRDRNGNPTLNLNLNCANDSACENIKVFDSSKYHAMIVDCSGEKACNDGLFLINSTYNLKQFSCFSTNSCANLTFWSPHNAFVQCEGADACSDLKYYSLYGVDNPHSTSYLNCDSTDPTVCSGAYGYCNPGFVDNCRFEYFYGTREWKCQGVCGYT